MYFYEKKSVDCVKHIKKIGINALLVPTFWPYFYFDPYIFISLLLVPKLINACYFSPFH